MTGGSSAPSFHSTVTRLLARLTRAPRTPACRMRPFSIATMHAPQVTPSTTRSIAATPSAGWRTKCERSCASVKARFLVRGGVRNRQFVFAAKQAFGPAACLDHQSPAARRDWTRDPFIVDAVGGEGRLTVLGGVERMLEPRRHLKIGNWRAGAI